MTININKIKEKLIDGLTIIRNILSFVSLRVIIIFLSIQIVIVILLFILVGIIPVRREMQSFLSDEGSGLQIVSPSEGNRKIIEKIKSNEHHEAFLKSTLQLSKHDSISLLVDLSDSMLVLTFKGIYLFESRISSIYMNKGLRRMPLTLRDSLFSGPMEVFSCISSIEKFPLVVKKAPKDTTEASLTSSEPQLPRQSDVFFLYEFENGLFIEIGQEEKELIGGGKEYRKYERGKALAFREMYLKSIFYSKEKGYIYYLKIELPREEARAIFRALPDKPLLAVRYHF